MSSRRPCLVAIVQLVLQFGIGRVAFLATFYRKLIESAYGVKISGAGLWGSLVALVESVEDGQRIVEAAEAAGAKQRWASAVGQAARIERGKDLPDS